MVLLFNLYITFTFWNRTPWPNFGKFLQVFFLFSSTFM